jgi:adenosylcobyric acid synthase
VETAFAADKRVTRCRGRIAGGPGFFERARGCALEGYEIHLGDSRPSGTPGGSPFLLEGLDGPAGEAGSRSDGAASRTGKVWGTYLHGVFDLPEFRRAWLDSLLPPGTGRLDRGQPGPALSAAREAALDRLADCLEENLDIEAMAAMAGLPSTKSAKERP